MAYIPNYDEALVILKKYNSESFLIQHGQVVGGVMKYFAQEHDSDLRHSFLVSSQVSRFTDSDRIDGDAPASSPQTRHGVVPLHGPDLPSGRRPPHWHAATRGRGTRREFGFTQGERMPTKVLIMGAAGKDFHVFNTVYRGRDDVRVVAFTATQIPGIEGRRYPPELAGPGYLDGIPIEPDIRISPNNYYLTVS